MGDSFALLWVAAFIWNGWQVSKEYALNQNTMALRRRFQNKMTARTSNKDQYDALIIHNTICPKSSDDIQLPTNRSTSKATNLYVVFEVDSNDVYSKLFHRNASITAFFA
jgi:hypothetical protein